jgi:hypothetical protein
MSVRVRIFVVIGLLLVQAQSARGEERTTEGTSSRLESPRALNGQVFQPSRIVTGPFSATAFGMVTGFGTGEADAPRYDLQGNQIGTKKYTLGAFEQGFNADFRLTPDIALRLDVSGLVFTGTTGRGLLVAGASASFGGSLGVTAGKDLGRDRKMRLAFVFDVAEQPQFSLLVANAVRNAIFNGRFDDTGLFSTVNRVAATPGLSFAYAPAPGYGIVAETRYIWTRRVSHDTEVTGRTAQGFSLGALAAIDLEPLMRWPFGVQAGFRADVPIGSPGIANVRQASLGFFYTRRVRLALGLEALWRHGAVRPGVEPTLKADAGIANLIFRYYW